MAAATRSGRQHEAGFSKAWYPSLLISRLIWGRGRRRQARCVWLTEALVRESVCGCHFNVSNFEGDNAGTEGFSRALLVRWRGRRGRMPTPQTDAAELAQILRLVYQVLVFVRSNYMLKLLACVLVDAIGFSSFLLPGIGELGDVGWAPLQAWFLYFMFGSVRMSGIGFMEEILPGTDFVPSATIAWACENIDVTTLDALRALSGVVLRSHARSPRSPPRSSRPPHFL